MRFEGLGQRPRHGIADDDDGIDALGNDEVEHLLGVEVPRRIEHRCLTGVQADEAVPHGRRMHERWQRQTGERIARTDALGKVFRRRNGTQCRVVTTAAKRTEEQIFMRPHDALGHASGPPRVEDDQVVAASLHRHCH